MRAAAARVRVGQRMARRSMAIYNGVILDLKFPSIVYKQLLGVPPSFDDLAQVDAALHQGLVQVRARIDRPVRVRVRAPDVGWGQLLHFDGDVSAVYERTFEIEHEVFGELRRSELKPGGAALALTNANRIEYVQLYARHLLVDAVAAQWAAFKRGFDLVTAGSRAMPLFVWQVLRAARCRAARCRALSRATCRRSSC